MRCLKASNPEDVDRVASVISHNDWDIIHKKYKEYDRQSAVWVLQAFSVVVLPDEDED